MKDREAILRRVRALLKLAEDGSGATEAEALTAAEKARQLLEEHQLSASDVELMAEGFEDVELKKGDYLKRRVRRILSSAIAEWTGTISILVTERSGSKYTKIFGLKSDVTLAVWLTETLTDFVITGARRHTKVSKRRMTYAVAACTRICARLEDMTPSAQKSDGRSLVVAKAGLAMAEATRRLGVAGEARIRESKAVHRWDDVAAGDARGQAAQFNRPVESPKAHLALPGRDAR